MISKMKAIWVTNIVDAGRCPKCLRCLSGKTEGLIQGLYCTRCKRWGIVSTYIDEISADNQCYEIYIKESKGASIEKIKVVAKIANVNFLKSKEILGSSNVLILGGQAEAVRTNARLLLEHQIDFEIRPNYKYEI